MARRIVLTVQYKPNPALYFQVKYNIMAGPIARLTSVIVSLPPAGGGVEIRACQ